MSTRKQPKITVVSAAYLLNPAQVPEIPAVINYYVDVAQGTQQYRVHGTAWQSTPPHVVVSTLHATATPWAYARNTRLLEVVRDLVAAYLHTKEYADALIEFQRAGLRDAAQHAAYVASTQAHELKEARKAFSKAQRQLVAFNRKHPIQ